MKRILIVLVLVFGIHIPSFSQLANGSTAPDFTLTDRDGVTHHLYDYLSQGKVVFIKFFACHCPGCWSYHLTGKLDSLNQTYGPNGTDQIVVIMLEHDQNNPDAFYGLGGYTQGDWITGNSVPMVDVEGTDRTVFDDYNLNYYPMVMKVCSDKTTELMSTAYTVGELFQEADDCAGNLGTPDLKPQGEIFYDMNSSQLQLMDFNEILELNIYSLSGEIVMSGTNESNGFKDVSNLQAGMYIVQVNSAAGLISKKIIIQ